MMKNGRFYGSADVILLAILLMILSGFNSVNAETRLTASDGAEFDQFGVSVAISGNTAVIGASGDDDKVEDSGSAYVFVQDTDTGNWNEQAKLTASDGAVNDFFGASVAISGDTAVIGALSDFSSAGAAYVFVRDTATGLWSKQAKLTVSDGVVFFGRSVAISGNTTVIGAKDNAGSAYVFVRDTATGLWSEQAKLTASDGAAGDEFGVSVTISGDTIVIGAYQDNDKGTFSGSAYVFVRNPSTGLWSEQAKLTASDGAASDWFGYSIAFSGNTAVIGAWFNDDNGSDSGSAYVFVQDTSTGLWSEQAKLLASDGAAEERFGGSVAISGDTAVIGADWDDDKGTGSGSAYVFVRNPITGVWSLHSKLRASDGAVFDRFGNSVAISGGTAVIGVSSDDDKGLLDTGSAYVYKVNPLPDIKVNAEGGTVTLTPTDNLSVTVALNPLSRLGDDADWWAAARVSGTSIIDGWYHFDLSTLRFVYAGDSPFNLIVTHQGPLINLTTFPVVNNIPVSGLPSGIYTFYFAVDMNRNGLLDTIELFFDSVIVNIIP